MTDKYNDSIELLYKKNDIEALEWLLDATKNKLLNSMKNNKTDKSILQLLSIHIAKTTVKINNLVDWWFKRENGWYKQKTHNYRSAQESRDNIKNIEKIITDQSKLLEITNTAFYNKSLNDLLQRIEKSLASLCSCGFAVYYQVIEKEWQKYLYSKKIIHSISKTQKWNTELLIPLDKDTIEWQCVLNNEDKVINEARNIKTYNEVVGWTQWKVYNSMLFPINIFDFNNNIDKVVGLLQIYNKVEWWTKVKFDASNQKTMSYFAKHISLALQLLSNRKSINKTLIDIVNLMINILESRDKTSIWHSKNINNYSMIIGKKLWLSKHDLNKLDFASLLHDIWRIWLKDEVMFKTWKLTVEEQKLLEEHTIKWEKLLKKIPFLKDVAMWAALHHERVDWKWYPHWLKKNQISLIGKIIAVADMFDNLMIKENQNLKRAISKLSSMKKIQLDSKITKAFIKCLENWNI